MSAVAEPALDLTVPDDVRVIASDAEAIAAAAAYAAAIGPDAVARDRERQVAVRGAGELALTGLLGVRVPRAHGGAGVSSATVAEVFRLRGRRPRRRADPAEPLLFVDSLIRYGRTPARPLPARVPARRAARQRALRAGREDAARLGHAGGAPPDGAYLLNGRKYYATGALTAQWIPVFAHDEDDATVIAYVPRTAPGVHVGQDWDAFGQRATFSGSVVLENVVVPRASCCTTRSSGASRARSRRSAS